MAQDIFDVKPHIRERAHIKSMEEYQRLYRRSLEDPEEFWAEQAKALTWFHPWHKVLDADHDGDLDLFVAGSAGGSSADGAPAARLFRNNGTGRFTE